MSELIFGTVILMHFSILSTKNHAKITPSDELSTNRFMFHSPTLRFKLAIRILLCFLANRTGRIRRGTSAGRAQG